MYKLVLLRHGESTWNRENRFTGWTDVDLSDQGRDEAAQAGRLLKDGGYIFDQAYVSVLKRAIRTLWIALDQLDQMWLPVEKSWRLNERHYGALQGLNKAETAAKHGEEQVLVWRRSYDVPPPPLTADDDRHASRDLRYAGLAPGDLPLTESLKDTVSFIGQLPAFRWMFWVGVFAIFGGTMVDFGFLHLATTRYSDAGSLQAVYAGTSLVCFVACWLLQNYGSTKIIKSQGIARVLQLLPSGALLGGAVLVVGGATTTVVLGSLALVIWRIPRWSIDGSARQAAMASLPDERRLRVSFAIDMGPLALSLILAAGPIALAVQTHNLWIAPLIGVAFAAVGLLLSRNTVRTWDDTQLSYRLKRRKRLG